MTQRIGDPQLARLLHGWSRHEGPLHDQLARALRALVISGAVPQGTALPSERALSTALAVSRTTIATAYDQLRAEDWLESRHGSNTWVRRNGQANSLTQHGERLQSFLTSDVGVIDLSSSALPGLPLVAEIAQRRSWLDHLPDLLSHSGFQPYGLDLLRDRVAHYYDTLGLATRAEQILITNGAQHALQLLATALVEPDDQVVVEDTTYRGAIELFRMRGARLIPITTDDEGMDLHELEKALRINKPRMIYLLPTAHNPTGRSWSSERRQALARLTTRYRVRVVDDGSTMDLLLSASQPRPLARDLTDPPTLSIGSTTKLFWGGLRVGWIRVCEELLETLTKLRCAYDLGGSLLPQILTAELLPHASQARATRRGQITGNLAHASDLLTTFTPNWTWTEPSGGNAIWIHTNDEDAVALTERARRHGVHINPGSIFSPHEAFRHYLRLPLTSPPPILREAIQRIATARTPARGL